MIDVLLTEQQWEPPKVYEVPHGRSAELRGNSCNLMEQVFCFADVVVDIGRRKVTRGGDPVKITPAEYKLLVYFLQNVDRALTRDAILNAAWGYDFYPKTRTVDAHVARLRRKLEPDPAMPTHFLTIHGVGYRFLL